MDSVTADMKTEDDSRNKRRMRDQNLRNAREAQGLCITCGSKLPEGHLEKQCPSCLDKKKQSSQRTKAMREAQGLCVMCGRKLPEGYQNKSCAECLKLRREKRQKKGAESRETLSDSSLTLKVEEISNEAFASSAKLEALADSMEQTTQEARAVESSTDSMAIEALEQTTSEDLSLGAMPGSEAVQPCSDPLRARLQSMSKEELVELCLSIRKAIKRASSAATDLESLFRCEKPASEPTDSSYEKLYQNVLRRIQKYMTSKQARDRGHIEGAPLSCLHRVLNALSTEEAQQVIDTLVVRGQLKEVPQVKKNGRKYILYAVNTADQ